MTFLRRLFAKPKTFPPMWSIKDGVLTITDSELHETRISVKGMKVVAYERGQQRDSLGQGYAGPWRATIALEVAVP